jgi:hypothetical protein
LICINFVIALQKTDNGQLEDVRIVEKRRRKGNLLRGARTRRRSKSGAGTRLIREGILNFELDILDVVLFNHQFIVTTRCHAIEVVRIHRIHGNVSIYSLYSIQV